MRPAVRRLPVAALTTVAAVSAGRGVSALAGDLATGTGTASPDQRTWRFTLRPGIAWQDGAPVTCEDVRYGISRTFATKQITGGPTYALALLDVPVNPDGTSRYAGPSATGTTAAAGRAAYDKAVTCSDRTLTVRLAVPSADVNETLSLPAFAPYPKAHDEDENGTYAVWSDGPYRLKEAWQESRGGTFVRNPHWDKQSDPIRQAHPDEIRYEEGVEVQTAAQLVMADGDDARASVTLEPAPPELQQRVSAAQELRDRSVNPGTGLVDYLAPNLKSAVFASRDARRALAMATDRDAYVTALGGSTAATAAYSLVPAGLTAHRAADLRGGGGTGDPTATTALRARAGLPAPVRIPVAYRSSPSADKAMAALGGYVDLAMVGAR